MLFFFVQLWSHYLQWESDALLFIQDHLRAPALDLLFRPISALGNAGLVWIALGLALICFRKTRKTGIFLLLSLLAGLLFNNLLLKNLVARARPYEVIPGLSILCAPPGDRSFPSGHTCAAFASAGAFLWSRGWHWETAVVWSAAILMGFSRLYLGVHYPSDVLVGALCGLLCSYLVWRLGRRPYDVAAARLAHRRSG